MTVKLNDSVLEMKLNAENRSRFIEAILKDALGARSNKVREEMRKLTLRFIDLTWGKTPQARNANKKLNDQLIELQKKIKDRNIKCAVKKSGEYSNRINLNLGGLSFKLQFVNTHSVTSTVDFTNEFLKYQSQNHEYHSMGNDELTLVNEHPDAIKFGELKHEAEQIAEASEELTAILNTIMGKSRTLRDAVKKWPDLSNYAPSLMSASREIIVRPEDLSAKLKALKSGTKSVKQAMNAQVKK